MNEPLAIVGMACRLPGADGIEAFWRLVAERGIAWGPLPESRLPRDLYFDPEKGRVGRSYSELGGVVSDRPVDPSVCPITPDAASRYDIAHQIFLEVASLACRDAGMDPFAMPSCRRTGVYVGHTGGSTRISDIVYATGIDEAVAMLGEAPDARDLLGASVGDVVGEVVDTVRRRYPGRRPGERLDLGAVGAAQIVHELLRLDGPFLAVDAACASSLQALAIGARALVQGSIDQAIVGGASYCKSDSLVLFSAAQSVSNTGSCPFGEAADGLVTAEGYVALVIKTLPRAIADGDRIRAVIRGLGVSSDGKGKSLWSPRQEGQMQAVERAYPDPADLGRIEYIEAHATSTQVGDATELAALGRLLAPHVVGGRKIPIGSVKANIGHTLETAGIASLVKVVLAMEHGVIPPGSTCDELNREFDWQNGPFTVPRAPLAWPAHADGTPRQAAVNAFGIGGLNVHVALAEHVPYAAAPSPEPPACREAGIAIVGAGCVLPGAIGIDAFYDRVNRGESAIGPAPPDRWQAARALDRSAPRTWHSISDRGGFVRDFVYDWRRHKVPPKQISAANPLQFMLLEAADEAIADARGRTLGLDRTRTGVVVGTLFGGDFANQLQMGLRLPETCRDLRAVLARRAVSTADVERIVQAYEEKVLERMPAIVDETGSFTSSTLASRLTKTFDLMGGALALDAGDCSSIAALSAAADMLRQGDCDAVICAAGQRSLDLMAFESLSLVGAIGDGVDAVVPGEGVVVFVLKRLEDARASGDRIRGVIHGAEVRSTPEPSPKSSPALADVFGHTGATAGAAELLSLTMSRAGGTVSMVHGPLVGRVEVGEPVRPAAVVAASLATPARGRPLVAALFPGQGSQYTDMFRALVAESAAAREVLARLDRMAHDLGHETLAEIAWRANNGLGTRIWDTQWAMYLGDLLAWEVLRAMDFSPDIVAGHSFGEFPALVATASWTIEEGARATRARADAVEQHGPHDGAMLSVIADHVTVQAAIEPFAGHVWVCAENAPEQFVIGGTMRVVDAVESLLEIRRVRSKRIAVPSPFHTPLLARAAEDLAVTIDSLSIGTPAIPMISSTTLLQMTGPATVRQSLVRQMTETVGWVAVVEQLHAAGVRTFVEVGPSGVLTGLVRRILENCQGCTYLQFDQRGRAVGEHLSRLREQLVKAGCIPPDRPPGGAPSGKTPRPVRGTIVSFDATARRRQRNRGGLGTHAAPRDEGRRDVITGREAIADVAVNGSRQRASQAIADDHESERSIGSTVRGGANHGDASRNEGVPVVADRKAVQQPAPPASDREVETFLVDFVVEQTGYPREIVELDADLEADLGIDSIRKAQLFGEIGQKYAIQPDDRVSFEDFPTLRHLLDYVLPRADGGAATLSRARRASIDLRLAGPTGRLTGREASPVVEPAVALGGFDALLVAASDPVSPRGLIVCFGRHACPEVRRVESRGLRATLVSAHDGPGALVGWNDAGLIVFVNAAHGPVDVAASIAVEEIVSSCRSTVEARRLLEGSSSRAADVVVAHACESVEQRVPRNDQRSPLARVLLADGVVDEAEALTVLLDGEDAGARAALSATCVWFAVGVSERAATAVSGGPFAGAWLGCDAAVTAAAWQAAARARRRRANGGTAADPVTRRYALVRREIGPPQRVRSLAGERVLVLADKGLAESLARQIEALGGVAVPAGCGSTAESITAVERAERAGPVRHLVLAGSRRPSEEPWTRRIEAAITAPFAACQRWMALRSSAGDLDSATLTAVVDLGGDFGISGVIGTVEGGAIAGLFKGLAREFPALHVRVVDASPLVTLPQLAAAVVDEMRDAAGPVEVGLMNGRRVTVVPCDRRPQPGKPLETLSRGSVWIATGGARGVTAACARELGRRHGLAFALVGSTSPVAVDRQWLMLDGDGLMDLKRRWMLEARGKGVDPRSSWRTIEKSIEIEKTLLQFRADGIECRYFSCDVADESAVRSLVHRVVREMGAVRGVLHGAGFESACRFEKKTLPGLLATLGPKCIGIEHLLAALDPGPLEAVVGFGSTSGRLGGLGQADYSLANDLLAKITGHRRRSGLRATVFHWHAWDEVGMATRPESRFVLQQVGMTFMPVAEGVSRFMDEIEAGLPDAEVLVTAPACVPDAMPAAAAGSPGSLVEAVRAGPGSTEVAFLLNPATDRFLLDHLQYGRPLLPAAMGVELLAQAAIAAGACATVQEIRDFSVERPMAFSSDQPRSVHVHVTAAGESGIETVGWCAATAGEPHADEQRVILRGIVAPAAASPIEEKKSVPPLPFNPMVYADDAPLRHGDSLRALTGLFLDRSGGWGRLVAPEADVVAAPRGAAGWTVPIALLDGCVVACAVYSYILCGLRVEVPVRFERLRITAAPQSGETCMCRLFFRSNNARESVYDLTLFGEDGRALLAIDGLHLALTLGER